MHLNAYHKGGSINIVISDDGSGLDKASASLEKARSKGLIDANAQLTDEQIYDLIFLPGFSTAAQTTDLSGRGVGMDVVRRNIKELGGSVELRTRARQGHHHHHHAAADAGHRRWPDRGGGHGNLHRAAGRPIVESLQLKAGAASQIYNHGEVFSFRGDYLPIIRLHEVFGVAPRSTVLHEGLIMVVEGDGRRAGLFIDELLGQQQVVIKSMETNYARIEGVGGATILGEGTVALILDVPGLLRMSPPGRSGCARGPEDRDGVAHEQHEGGQKRRARVLQAASEQIELALQESQPPIDSLGESCAGWPHCCRGSGAAGAAAQQLAGAAWRTWRVPSPTCSSMTA